MLIVLHSMTPGAILGNLVIVTGSFVTLVILLRLFAWNKITAIFEKRAETIATDLDKAEEARVKAEEYVAEQEQVLKDSRLEASQIIGKANARAAHDKEAILLQAKEEAQVIKDKAHQDAVQIKADAIESAKEEVARLAVDLAERILMTKLSQEEQSHLVDRYLDRLGEN